MIGFSHEFELPEMADVIARAAIEDVVPERRLARAMQALQSKFREMHTDLVETVRGEEILADDGPWLTQDLAKAELSSRLSH